ncbi:hypothetical protein [Enterococcus phage PEF1]|nr:hypothetical protein [Enterococcus phage UTI-EfS3]
MNKQEAIKELESHRMSGTDIRAFCYNDGINAGIAVMKKLDEPQKPVVPKFVAEWFEENKDDLHNNLFGEIGEAWEIVEYPEDKTDFQKWLNATPDCMNIVLSMKNGYEVKKEQLYEVIIGDLYLIKKFNDRNDFCFNDKFELCWWEKSAYQLTEAEIKAIDERFWLFAVPVEKRL